MGIEPGVAAAGIARGTIDYIAAQDAALAPDTVSARTAGARYRLTANNWTERLALNVSKPPFSDASTRRAVALALDRRQLAHALVGGDFQLPTSTLLPPNLRGSTRPTYPLRPDLRLARRLMAGRHLHAVFAAEADDAGNLFDPQLAQLLRIQLARIGITLTVVPLLQTLDPTQRDSVLATADLARTGGNADDAADPVQYLLHLPYLTASDRRELEASTRFLRSGAPELPQPSQHDSSAKRPTSAIRTAPRRSSCPSGSAAGSTNPSTRVSISRRCA